MSGPRTRRLPPRAVAVAAVSVAVIVASIRWRPGRVAVSGESMAPTLLPGDWALAVPARAVRVGDVVVVEHPDRPGLELVKRVIAGPGDLAPDGVQLGADEWWIQGDNAEGSTDSTNFGSVSSSAIRLRVLAIYAPGARRRVL